MLHLGALLATGSKLIRELVGDFDVPNPQYPGEEIATSKRTCGNENDGGQLGISTNSHISGVCGEKDSHPTTPRRIRRTGL